MADREWITVGTPNRPDARVSVWKPDGAPRAIIQIFHGMAEHIERYDRTACDLARKGYLVAGHNHMGHGPETPEGKLGYFYAEDGWRKIVEDGHAVSEALKERWPGIPLILLGHSMGSFLARQFLCLRGASLTAAVISGTAFHPAPETRLGMFFAESLARRNGWFYRSPFLNHMSVGTLNKQFEPARTKVDWLTRDESIVDAYVADRRTQFVFTCNAFYALFQALRYLTSKSNLEHMPKNLPVLFIAGGKDPVGNNGDGPRKVAAQFKSLGLQDTQIRIYEEDRHEVLNELDKETVYADVLHFLEGTLC